MSDDLLDQFLIEGREQVAAAEQALARLRTAPDDAEAFEICFRALHTLKGGVGLFNLPPMALVLHRAEDVLAGARSRRREPAETAALLEVVDQVDRWLETLETSGRLPDDAPRLAADLIARLEGQTASVAAEPGQGEGAVLIRYAPHEDAYFSGDDPLAILLATPGLESLRVSARAPWAPRETYDPYACNLVIEAVSTAPREAVRAALRLVVDQVTFSEVAPTADVALPAPPPATLRTLRVEATRVDRLAALTDELITVKGGLARLAAQAQALPGGLALAQALRAHQGQMDRLAGEMHAAVGAVRLAPLQPLFGRFPRLVREAAGERGKTVVLEVAGGEVEIDKAVVDALFEPLLHVLRNAVDHGVEPAETRRAAGKPEAAVIRLSARTAAGRAVIEVRDDGAGVRLDRLREAAVRRGLIGPDDAAALDDGEALELIFAPGLSTALAVSDLSGRGVGMDAVRAAVRRIGGQVRIDSVPGSGTGIVFNLPLTIAMTRLLVLETGGERYGLPLEAVRETLRLGPEAVVPVRAGRAFVWRDEVLPLLSLAEHVGAARRSAGEVVCIVATGTGVAGLAVEAVVDRIEAVVRPTEGLLAGAPGLAGAAIMADGEVLLVIDPEEVVR